MSRKVSDNADVRQVARQRPSDEILARVALGAVRQGEFGAEERCEIWHSWMISMEASGLQIYLFL